jgi:hypothetical protein
MAEVADKPPGNPPIKTMPDEVVDNIKLVLDAPADDAHDTCLRKCRTVLKKGGHVNA